MPEHWTAIHGRFPELCEGVKRKGHPHTKCVTWNAHKGHCNTIIGRDGMCNRSLEQAAEDMKLIRKGGSPWISKRQ